MNAERQQNGEPTEKGPQGRQWHRPKYEEGKCKEK